VRQGVFQFGLPASERPGIVEMLNALGAVGLNYDELETARGCGTRFATDKVALPFVKPHHA
jgi:hypothetical protein